MHTTSPTTSDLTITAELSRFRRLRRRQVIVSHTFLGESAVDGASWSGVCLDGHASLVTFSLQTATVDTPVRDTLFDLLLELTAAFREPTWRL
jgi:hypothetical protein